MIWQKLLISLSLKVWLYLNFRQFNVFEVFVKYISGLMRSVLHWIYCLLLYCLIRHGLEFNCYQCLSRLREIHILLAQIKENSILFPHQILWKRDTVLETPEELISTLSLNPDIPSTPSTFTTTPSPLWSTICAIGRIYSSNLEWLQIHTKKTKWWMFYWKQLIIKWTSHLCSVKGEGIRQTHHNKLFYFGSCYFLC